MRTKFWQNYFLGKGFAKTSAHLFLNSDVANGKGGVWGGIFHLLLFLFWGNSGGLTKFYSVWVGNSVGGVGLTGITSCCKTCVSGCGVWRTTPKIASNSESRVKNLSASFARRF